MLEGCRMQKPPPDMVLLIMLVKELCYPGIMDMSEIKFIQPYFQSRTDICYCLWGIIIMTVLE